jgi:MFS family permease
MSASEAKRSVLFTVSQTRRRVLVIVMYLFMFASSLVLALGPDSWWIVIAILLAQAIHIIVFIRLINPINKEVANKKDPDLDERQLAARNRAHYHAYQILATFLISIVTLPMAAALYGGASFPMSFTTWHFQALFLFSTYLIVSLPASALAWMEPDPRPDE